MLYIITVSKRLRTTKHEIPSTPLHIVVHRHGKSYILQRLNKNRVRLAHNGADNGFKCFNASYTSIYITEVFSRSLYLLQMTNDRSI